MSPEVARRRTRALARVSVVLVIVIGIAVAGLVFAAFGWQRMDIECRDPEHLPPGATAAAVRFSWDWAPPGFTCTWPVGDDDEVSVTKFWW